MIVSMNTISVLTETSAYSERLNPRQKTRVLEARALSMSELVAALEADKPILDKTGLTGLYQFRIELHWRSDPPYAGQYIVTRDRSLMLEHARRSVSLRAM